VDRKFRQTPYIGAGGNIKQSPGKQREIVIGMGEERCKEARRNQEGYYKVYDK